MSYTLINPNLDSNGYSDDNFLQHELDMGVNIALVRNSPKLVAMNADSRVNITSIYRAAGDGNFSKPAAQFVNERYSAAPQAAYLHLTNEAGLPPPIGAWSLQCADAAEGLKRKVVAFNAATNTDVALWKAQESAIRELVRRGHKIGLHLYLDGKNDAGGYAAADWLKSISADCFWTEYGYIRTITKDGEGYRGVLDDGYADWLEAHAAKLDAYGWPAFLFSIDQWPNNDEGRAKGFGTEDRPKIHQRCKVINLKYPLGGIVTPPPVIQIPVDPGAAVPSAVLESGIRLRAAPSLSAPELRKLALHEIVATYPATRTNVAGYPFQFTETATGDGWAAVAALNGAVWIRARDTQPFTLHPPFADYQIVSHFNAPRPGYVKDYPGKLALHEGVDFEPADGSLCDPVVHVGAACTVLKVDSQPTGYGLYVVVDFGNGYRAVYAHFAEIWVQAGQRLADRQILGLMGETGTASEPHVHLTLSNPALGADNYVFAAVVNPELYLSAQPVEAA